LENLYFNAKSSNSRSSQNKVFNPFPTFEATDNDMPLNQGDDMVDDGPEQSWFNDLANAEKPPLTFDDLMTTHIDFSAFAMNRLNISKLTKADLVRRYIIYSNERAKVMWNWNTTLKSAIRLYLINLTGTTLKEIVVPMTSTNLYLLQESQGRLTVPADFLFNNDLEYLRRGSTDRNYMTSTTKTKAAKYEIKGIEDMVLKLWSPIKSAIYCSLRTLRSNLRRQVEKEETDALGYNKTIEMRKWTITDQKRSRIMIKDINQQLLKRRIMRSLEKKPPLTFDDLMTTYIDFSAFAMNCLKISKPTKADLVGRYIIYSNERAKVMWNWNTTLKSAIRLYLINLSGTTLKEIVVPMTSTNLYLLQESQGRLTVPVDFLFNNDLEYLRRGSTDRNYMTSTTKTKAAKYEIKDKLKRKRLMRIDELYKFCDGTLTLVRNTLDHMLKNLRLGYNKTIEIRKWTVTDQKRSRIMIKDINQQLLKRRIMRSLEKFVGGRDYGTDYRLLQRTQDYYRMDNPNITIKEYIRLKEEKAHRHGKVYNWETAKYGKIWCDEDIHDLRSVETKFLAIVFNDNLTFKEALPCEPMNKMSKTYNLCTNLDDFIDMVPLPPRDQRHLWLRYQEIFVSNAWRRLFEIRAPLVQEFTLEFFITFRIGSEMRLDVADTLCFQLGGARGVANVPYLLEQYLFRHAMGRKSGARLSGGHSDGCLSHHFGLVNDDRLRGLSFVTRKLPLIDMERYQVTAAAYLEGRTMPQRLRRLEEEIHGVRQDVRSLRGFMERLMTDQGISQVKDYKIDFLVQQYEQFTILEEEYIDSGFARFNTIITSLKALDKESKDLSSLALDELIDNLKLHKVVMEKDFKIYKGKKERVKSIDLKAKKESSDDETLTFGSDEEEYAMAVRNFKSSLKERVNLFGNQEKNRGHSDKEMRRIERVTGNVLDAVIQIISLAIVQNHLATKIIRISVEVLGAIAKMTLKTKLTMKLVSWLNRRMRGRKHSLEYFKVFGSKCFILNTKDYLTKFDPKSYKGVFLGYSQNSKAYVVLNKHAMKVKESLNVTFDESLPPTKLSPLIDDDYVKEMLKKFGLKDSKPTKTPMSTKIKLTKDDEADSVDSSKYQENPKTSHLEAVKRIFGYIRGNSHLGLWYPKGIEIETVVYANSDHAGDYVDRKSTTGVCTFIGCCLTSWFAKKQMALAISTIKSEYVSA
nr:copia protein [Tanacetum cinerariifolium]